MITNLLPDSFCERAYIQTILGHLADLDDYHIVATYQDKRGRAELPEVGPRVVALITSGETYPTPICLPQVYRVWACYVRHETVSLKALPLGPVWDVPELPPVPPRKRSVDVFFVGQARHRQWLPDLGQTLRRAGLKTEIILTPAFRKGLVPAEYARQLMNARVALCPRGVSAETFRHFEALRSGCAVVSDQLPLNNLYVDSPIRQVRDWKSELVGVVRQLVDKIEDESVWARECWERRFSPEAVAGRIRRDLTRVPQGPSVG